MLLSGFSYKHGFSSSLCGQSYFDSYRIRLSNSRWSALLALGFLYKTHSLGTCHWWWSLGISYGLSSKFYHFAITMGIDILAVNCPTFLALVTHSYAVWVTNILSMWVQGCCCFLFLFPFSYLCVVIGSLIISHFSYYMTLSIWLNLFDHSVELGSSDISGPILSSRYDSSRNEREKWFWWSKP